MTLPGRSEDLQLVAIVAHPHDITHMLGTCAHHIDRGDAVTVVSATPGGSTHPERLHDELRKPPAERDMEIVQQSSEVYTDQKINEMHEACRLFGINDVRVLDFADKPLLVTDELVQALAEILYELRPQILLTHAPYGWRTKGHVDIMLEDHNAAGMAVQRARTTVGTPDRQNKRAPHHVAAIYYTGVDCPRRDIDVFIDITDQAANRVAAEALFTTQGHTADWARRRIEVNVGSWGWAAGVAYAEPFLCGYSQVASCLTVTDEDLAKAKMSRTEAMAMRSQLITAPEEE